MKVVATAIFSVEALGPRIVHCNPLGPCRKKMPRVLEGGGEGCGYSNFQCGGIRTAHNTLHPPGTLYV